MGSTQTAQSSYVETEYTRDTEYLDDRITRDAADADRWPVEAGRYRLVVSRACP
jgi:glutathionyl-hydroquinone reductase